MKRDDRLARALRGFGPAGLLAFLVIALTGNVPVRGFVVPVGALLALAWAKLSGTPWSEMGYVRPQRPAITLAAGVVFGAAFKFLMKAIVMPLLGAPAINAAYHFLAGNRAMLPAAIWAMLVAGFAEETVFRGYAFERMGRLIGTRPAARTATVLVTAALFGLAHWPSQGWPGVEQALIVGLVFGGVFARTGGIWMLMCAHAAFDLAALGMIYWNVESNVAHWVFR